MLRIFGQNVQTPQVPQNPAPQAAPQVDKQTSNNNVIAIRKMIDLIGNISFRSAHLEDFATTPQGKQQMLQAIRWLNPQIRQITNLSNQAFIGVGTGGRAGVEFVRKYNQPVLALVYNVLSYFRPVLQQSLPPQKSQSFLNTFSELEQLYRSVK